MTHEHFSDNPLIIEGQPLDAPRRRAWQQLLRRAGVSLIGRQRMARISLGETSVIVRAIKFVVRPSGWRRRHLSHYLIGTLADGTLWEIFLGEVQGLRNGLFQLRVAIQECLLRAAASLLSPGLSARQLPQLACA